MRKLALFIGRNDLAKHANIILILGFLMVVLMILMAVAMLFVPGARMLMIVVALIGLALFVKYANLINALRKALRNQSAPLAENDG